MKKTSLHFVNLIALFALVAISASVLTGCQPEGCTDPQSDTYDPKAKKDDGSCVPWRDKFVANYTGKNACAGSADQDISIVVTASGTTEDGVVITLSGAGLLFTATVNSKTGLVIPNQQISYQGSTVNISGTGSLKNEMELTLDYDLSSGPLTVPCSVTGNQL
ncbi:MAG: hypothetical protein IPL49_04560 [Saprospirales bacterium]|nr:hypothetical protein [Saprospirales bacterium]